MSEVLYRKHRPRNFAEVVGQDHIVPVLTQAILQGKFSHAYLFSGPRGTGKTSVARLFARAINCTNFQSQKDICGECDACRLSVDQSSMQIIEIDAASNRGINEIKQLKETLQYLPPGGKYKLYIIDEVHMLSADAFNALLKTIEEPPAHVIFIFATTELHKVPQTIMSRVQHFQFRLATTEQMQQKLQRILIAEGWELDSDVFKQVYNYSEGSYRDAESLLGKLFASDDIQNKKITTELFNRIAGYVAEEQLAQLTEYLLVNDISQAVGLLHEIESQILSWYQLNKQLLTYLKNTVLQKLEAGQAHDQYLRLLKHFASLQTELRDASYPKLNFEIGVVTAMQQSAPIVTTRNPPIDQINTSVKQVAPETKQSEIIPAKKVLVSDTQQSKPKTEEIAPAVNEVSVWPTYLNNVKKANIAFWLKLKPIKPVIEGDVVTVNITEAGTFALLNQEYNKQILMDVWQKTAPTLTLKIEPQFTQPAEGEMVQYSDNSNLVEQLL